MVLLNPWRLVRCTDGCGVSTEDSTVCGERIGDGTSGVCLAVGLGGWGARCCWNGTVASLEEVGKLFGWLDRQVSSGISTFSVVWASCNPMGVCRGSGVTAG